MRNYYSMGIFLTNEGKDCRNSFIYYYWSLMFCIYIDRFTDHEHEVGRIAMEMGFTHVSMSSDVMPMIRVVPRGYTGTHTFE